MDRRIVRYARCQVAAVCAKAFVLAYSKADIHLHYPPEKQLPANIFIESDHRFMGTESSFDGLLVWLWSRLDESTSVADAVFTLQVVDCVLRRTDSKHFCGLRITAAHTLPTHSALLLDFDSILCEPDVAVVYLRFGPENI
jgi:hypothetical protein